MKVIIGSDIVPTKSNQIYFEKGNIEKILDRKIVDIIDKSDIRIFNLECVLGENLKPIDKCGPNLISSSKSINLVKKLNPDMILLANNHILDYGQDGLKNTMKLLKKNNIKYTGIINNCLEKFNGDVIEKEGIRLGVYNVCEHEFSVATEKTLGTNPLNMLKNCMEILELKKNVDYLIVIFHGGKEFYRYPSPDLQKNCRAFIDYGADFVITQHSHCIGCEEIYKSKKIIYGQGNFIFDRKDDEYWNSELLVEIEIKNKEFLVKYYPIEKKNGKYFLDTEDIILKDFYLRSNQIKENNFIQEKYNEFSSQKLQDYLYACSNCSIIKKILKKVLGKKYTMKGYSKGKYLAILNFIECEAHRELFINGLKEKLKSE